MDEHQQKKGRCVSCGFLAKFDLHQSAPPPYIYEMPPKDRDSGEISTIRLEAGRSISLFPQCYIKAADLWSEVAKVRAQHGQDAYVRVQQLFDKDRHCTKWHRYTQGFSPQEHLEEIRMTELELKRQEFELKLFEMNRSLSEKADKSNRRVTVVLIIFAVLEVVFGAASVMQLAYPNGWPWLMNLLGNVPPSPPNIPSMPEM